MAEPRLLLGPRVEVHTQGGSRLWALGLDVPEAVSFAGSLATGADLGTAERQHLRFVARLLDRGSEAHDRFAIAEWLERRGAHLAFSTDGDRITFRGRALRADAADVLALAAELVATPRFEPDEVEKVRRELDARLRDARSDTGYLADAALSERIYAPPHPGYLAPLDEKARWIARTQRDEIRAFHEHHVAGRPVLLAVAGDLGGVALGALLDAFPHAEAPAAVPPPPVATHVPGRTALDVADKPNLDVRIGQGVAVTRHDERFLALYAGVYALGGNFSARLMQEVRDVRGLTYGIRAGLEHVDAAQQGHFAVRATFSTADLAAGIAAAQEVVADWLATGVGEEEHARVVETLVGQYDVSLSSTRGLADRLLARLEQGFEPAYLDSYRDALRALDARAVTDAMRQVLDPAVMHVATAGVQPEGVTGSSQN